MVCSLPGCPWNSPGKNTGVGSSQDPTGTKAPFPSPGDFPDPETEPGSPALQADPLPAEPPRKPDKTLHQERND